MQLRGATEDDVDAIVTLIESAYRGDGSRAVSGNELDGARFLGAHVAGIAGKLAG